jgi:hypothetical protein|nr:MAG TPA: hypothetical protein [Caudoviricetes sp.]
MENEKKFLLRLPASTIENLKKVNKYNLSLNKQINIIIFNYLRRVLKLNDHEADKLKNDMGTKRNVLESETISDEELEELMGDL